MAISNRYGVRLKSQEEKLLTSLAELLERNLSDTLRYAVRHTARDYGLLPEKKPSPVRARQQKKTGIKGGD